MSLADTKWMARTTTIKPLPITDVHLDKVSRVGIDVDSLDYDTYKRVIGLCEKFGKVVDQRSKKGWHFKIYLKEPVSLYRSFQIRYYCLDDHHRLCRDMLKAMGGVKMLDNLFDVKVLKNERITD